MTPVEILEPGSLAAYLGLRVYFRPEILRRSTTAYRVMLPHPYAGVENAIVVWSPVVLRMMIAGSKPWHDDADHCRTWGDGCGCRCETEEET